jgi:hypothetical protein
VADALYTVVDARSTMADARYTVVERTSTRANARYAGKSAGVAVSSRDTLGWYRVSSRDTARSRQNPQYADGWVAG